MDQDIVEIYRLIQELSWHFGDHGPNGECCGDLSLVEYMALKKIHESENITVQETANALNFTKSGASKIIDRLENKGYVVRQTSPEDGRVCWVNATERGAEVVEAIVSKYANTVCAMLRGLDSETLANIKSVLRLLVESAHKHGKSRKT